MNKLVTLFAVVLLAAAAGIGYLFLGPTTKLKTRGSVVAAEPASADPVEEIPSKTIRVEVSKETVDDFPATVTVIDGERRYITEYTGQYRRTKAGGLLKTYDIASYVTAPKKGTADELLSDLLVDGTPKVYLLRFVSSLPGKMLINDIYTRINESFTDVDVDRLQDSINAFCKQFEKGSKAGETVYMAWIPGGKVYSSFDKPADVTFLAKDFPFARALWRIWAGPTFGDIRFNLVRRYADPPLAK